MAGQDIDTAMLTQRLFDQDDDPEDLAYKQVVDSVIQQAITPSQAATELDAWVVNEANARFLELQGRKLTEEETNGLFYLGPNPSRHVDMLISCIARVCSAYPPSHIAQNALVELIQALEELPKHQAPSIVYDDSHQAVLDLAYPFSEVETPGSEFRMRWQNLQAFIARLTILDLVDCSAISALLYILPTSYAYPDLEKRPVGGPHRIAGDLVAASPWLVTEQACRWVHGKCKANASHVWTMENWERWMEQLSFIEGDARFEDDTRHLAALLKGKMEAQTRPMELLFYPPGNDQVLAEVVRAYVRVRTSNTDGLFLANGWSEDKLSTPEGTWTYAMLQCLASCRPEATFPTAQDLDAATPFLDPHPTFDLCRQDTALQGEQRWHEFKRRKAGKHVDILELGAGNLTPRGFKWSNEDMVERSGGSTGLIRVGMGLDAVAPLGLEEDGQAMYIDGNIREVMPTLCSQL